MPPTTKMAVRMVANVVIASMPRALLGQSSGLRLWISALPALAFRRDFSQQFASAVSARILISVARLRKQSWEKRSPKQGGTRRARTVEGRDALMREAHRLIEADKGNPPW
jgi:hypothetical protein